MSEQAIEALQAKRIELVNQIKELQLAVFHIDGALMALGARPGKRMNRNFRNGELVALIGEAERAGHESLKPITEYMMRKKGLDMEDEPAEAHPVVRAGMPPADWPRGAQDGG